MDSILFQKITNVPVAPAGYLPVAKSVASNDSLLFLFIESSGGSSVRERFASGIGTFPRATMREPKRFALTIVGSVGSPLTIELPELNVTFPQVDIFPTGKVLIVGPRCSWRAEGDY